MKELQHVPRSPGHEPPLVTAIDVTPARIPAVEMPGQGLKRDYAGMLEYWQMIRRHKGAVILATFLGGLIGFLITLPEHRIYQAKTTLEIQGLNEDFLNMRNVNPTSGSSSYSPDYDILTQVKILQSRTLIKRVLEKLEGQKRTENLPEPDRLQAWRKALRIAPPTPDALWRQALGSAAGNLKVRSSGTNRIVEVSSDSTSPQVAATFVNTLAQEFIEQNLEARWKSSEHTGEWLTRQLQDLKLKLEKSEEEVQAYARATGLVFTGEKNNVDETKLADLQKALSEAQTDRMTKQSKYEMAAASPPEALPDVLDDSTLRDSQATLTELKGKLAQLRVTYTPNHAEVRRVQAEITSREKNLESEWSKILTRIHNDYTTAQRREALLTLTYSNQARSVSAESAKASHYNLLRREVDTSRVLYETMLQKLKEASIASALRASNIRIVDTAEPPLAPYKPDISRSIIVGILSGIFLGIGAAVFYERADRTLQDPGDPAFYLGLPELGVVPIAGAESPRSKRSRATVALSMKEGEPLSLKLKNGMPPTGEANDERVELVTWNRRSSLLAESFRTTLTSILFSGQNGDRPRVLVLTSASPKEGKTTVVCNLGIALAEIKHRVLLIDADMRRPRLHSVFGVDNARGLSDLLVEKMPLDSIGVKAVSYETEIPGLSVMPAGGSCHGVSSLLHSVRLAELLKLVRENFDTVIIDTPPMVNISDARVVARQADALILVLRSASTTRDAALLAKRRFSEDGITILGTILNSWNPNTPGYGYYRYYYAGYYHYYGKENGNGNGNGHVNGGNS